MNVIAEKHEFLASLPSLALEILSISVVFLCGIKWWKDIYNYFEKRAEYVKLEKVLPCPPTIPLVGNALRLWESDRTPMIFRDISHELKSRTFRFWLGQSLKIIITDADDYEIILKSPKSTRKDRIYELMEPIIIKGLINAEGDRYRSHKRLLMPLFNKDTILQEYFEVFNRCAREFVKVLEPHAGAGEFDVEKYVEENICNVAIDSLVKTSQDVRRSMLDMLTKGLHLYYKRCTQPWLYPDFIFKFTTWGREWFKICDLADNFVNEVFAEKKLKEIPDGIMVPTIDFLLDHKKKTGEYTYRDIQSELMSLFIGLYEASQGMLCFSMLMLGMHSRIQEKIREEIENTVTEDEVTMEECVKMEYTDMFIREVMRLFPVGPVLPRVTTEPIKLTTCTVPSGISVYLMPYATHRDPKYWNNPEEFNPERFSPENSKDRHPYAFLPFSSGLRRCPGSKYGMMLLKVFITHVLRSYRVKSMKTLDKLRLHTHISMRSYDGYKVILEKI